MSPPSREHPAPRPPAPTRNPREALAGSRLVTDVRRHYAGSAAESFVERLKAVSFGTTITLLGSMALFSALPFMVLMDSFANRRIEDDLAHHMGLNDQAARIVDGLFNNASFHSISAIVLAVVFSVAGMIGMAVSMQRLYEQIFAQPHHTGGGQPLRLLLAIAVLCGWLALDSLLGTATRGLPGGRLLDAVAVLLAATTFFGVSMHLLLGGRVSPRRLLLPAAVSGVFWLGLQGFAALYFSSSIVSDSRLYGPVGMIFSLLTWFTAIAVVVVLGATTGEVWRQRRLARRQPPSASAPGEPAQATAAQVPRQSGTTAPA